MPTTPNDQDNDRFTIDSDLILRPEGLFSAFCRKHLVAQMPARAGLSELASRYIKDSFLPPTDMMVRSKPEDDIGWG